MALKKCPKCEINYMRETDEFCSVCRKEMNLKKKREPVTEICTECGENPAMPGRDICVACLREQMRAEREVQSWMQEAEETLREDVSELLEDDTGIEIASAVDMEEIRVETDELEDDIPSDELETIHNELGIDEEEEAEEEE